jgi:hypothetical protein
VRACCKPQGSILCRHSGQWGTLRRAKMGGDQGGGMCYWIKDMASLGDFASVGA